MSARPCLPLHAAKRRGGGVGGASLGQGTGRMDTIADKRARGSAASTVGLAAGTQLGISADANAGASSSQ
jgi:hypothetical protein